MEWGDYVSAKSQALFLSKPFPFFKLFGGHLLVTLKRLFDNIKMSDLQGNIALQDSPLKSDFNIEGASTSTSTLHEPVSATIIRDLKRIAFKLKYVLMPKIREDKCKELRDWDLWGPLLLCMLLSLTLSLANSSNSSEETASLVFSIVFSLISIGSVVITVNTLLLGGTISFF